MINVQNIFKSMPTTVVSWYKRSELNPYRWCAFGQTADAENIDKSMLANFNGVI